ncbi:hypothetical protein [Halomicrobium salinisoli]|uniref:hypothetical protein n=1 Tax=Halomicrobium salinisoli TaxID=2878391 RepID=UPI001CF05676|nr:hypothetical protein [Halomicrobium salinisoli]
MSEPGSADGAATTVEWRRLSPDAVASPVVRRLPYLEVKLEHPGLEPTARGGRFVPDAVPYELDGTPRVFYWRSALTPSSGEPSAWELTCASTHELVGVAALPSDGPALVTGAGDVTTLIVEGTVAGDATTCRVRSYDAPAVAVTDRSESGIELTVAGTDYELSAGERRRIALPEQRVEPLDGDRDPTTVAPELAVRYPGRRELHHPARGGGYRLFPSFGADLDEVANPLAVPTAAGELDHAALAADLGIDLSRRPYPERVLWQAFAYAAFDPHADGTPAVTQLESGHLVVRSERTRTG